LHGDSGKADAQHRGGQYAGEDRLFPLVVGQSCRRKADDDRIVAGEDEVDHHDLEKRGQGLGGKHLQHAGRSVSDVRSDIAVPRELPEGPGFGRIWLTRPPSDGRKIRYSG
jgi:hypothetical protein